MATKTEVPLIGPNYPHPNYALGRAWASMYAELVKAKRRKDPYLDGRVLAEAIAPDHDLVPATLVAVISRAAKAGLLDKELRVVISGRGARKRTHYKIKADA
jgi:hypothetical protein